MACCVGMLHATSLRMDNQKFRCVYRRGRAHSRQLKKKINKNYISPPLSANLFAGRGWGEGPTVNASKFLRIFFVGALHATPRMQRPLQGQKTATYTDINYCLFQKTVSNLCIFIKYGVLRRAVACNSPTNGQSKI